MLTPSGGTDSIDTVRRLNVPAPLRVEADAHGTPRRVHHRGLWRDVTRVRDRYRTDDRWWTDDPVSREYFELLLDGARPLTIFHDRIDGRWYGQRYG